MTAGRPRLFNIPADADFLPALVRAIDTGGFPLASMEPPDIGELPRWTILVPTRRAARALAEAFLNGSRGAARLLPQIRPIGDVDEDLFQLDEASVSLTLDPAISAAGRQFLLTRLIEEWASENPQEALAQEMRDAPEQRLGLAASLATLLDRLVTEGRDLRDVTALYDIDLATHRHAMISLLGLIGQRYHGDLMQHGLMDPNARRDALIRHQALTLIESQPAWPVIAAGSTGSIPATAELLKAIASLECGAVILPGLDLEMDLGSWSALKPQHAQYGLKRLLDVMGADRGEVEPLPGLTPTADGNARIWFAGEIMRPAETAAAWRVSLASHRGRFKAALSGLSLHGARSRREEAATIAVILREALETPDRTACLITPDRELAHRVSVELRRWNIQADDSAGEPLIASNPGRLVGLIVDAVLNGFDSGSLSALLHHPLAYFGLGNRGMAAAHIEIAVLRDGMGSGGVHAVARAVELARTAVATAEHVHPAIRRLSDRDWVQMASLAAALADALGPLEELADTHERMPLKRHLEALIGVIESIARCEGDAPSLWSEPAGAVLADLFRAMLAEADLHPPCLLSEALLIVTHHLRATPVRQPGGSAARVSILGLLEARLIRSDVVVLGGLNEGKWPAQPDPGPWLNRSMRDVLGLQMPERDIGLTAHDFAQALGARNVHLTWSDRIGGAPAVPSRWIVTAKMLAKSASLADRLTGGYHARLAAELDKPSASIAIGKPRPRPPLAARPKRFSVTEIETLIRDPYSIYARKILALEPLPPIKAGERHAQRGMLIHEALNLYAELTKQGRSDLQAALIEAGRKAFKPFTDDAEIMGFWWPRYERLARWFAVEDRKLRADLVSSFTEAKGKIEFPISGETHMLTARADRIDMLSNGLARIVDYKTGSVPSKPQVESGLKPQLTLEAAILGRDGFGFGTFETAELIYVRLTGGEPPGEIEQPLRSGIMNVAHRHLASLQSLLEQYARPGQAYLPALAMERERDRSDYDHLSRIDEWALAGRALP